MTAAIALAAGAGSAAASVTVRYRDAFTTTHRGAPTGRAFHDDFANAADPTAKPSPLTHFHLQLPAGASFDTGAVPTCDASDAELMLAGAGACPSASELGTEVLVFDSGTPTQRFHTEDVTFFNRKDALVILSQDRQSGIRVVIHGTVGRSTEDISLPPLPGTPPDGGADKSEDATYRTATTKNAGTTRAYLRTPSHCPASHRWTFTATYTFRDGSHVVKHASSPCTPKRRHKKRHKSRHRDRTCEQAGQRRECEPRK